MNTKMYVGNLPYTATEIDLRELFSPFGAVAQVEVPMDRDTGQPRGFAFVTMETTEAMTNAIREVNALAWKGRNLAVNEARPRAERPFAGAGGGDREKSKRW